MEFSLFRQSCENSKVSTQKMDILFVHNNFPGQFRHLAPTLARQGHRVVFLTNKDDIKEEVIDGVNIVKYKVHRAINEGTHHYLKATEEAIITGRQLSEIVRVDIGKF